MARSVVCAWHIEKNEEKTKNKSQRQCQSDKAWQRRAGNRKPLAVAGNWHLKVCRTPKTKKKNNKKKERIENRERETEQQNPDELCM